MTVLTECSRSVRHSPEDNGWIAHCDELPTISAFGDSREEALRELEVVLEEASAVYRANGWPLLASQYAEPPDLPSGEFRVRLPKTLHAQLSVRAEREGMSKNALVTYLLAGGVGAHRPLNEVLEAPARGSAGTRGPTPAARTTPGAARPASRYAGTSDRDMQAAPRLPHATMHPP